MLEMPDMAHDNPNMALVAPNDTGDMVWKFKQSGVVVFACLQPGHFDIEVLSTLELSVVPTTYLAQISQWHRLTQPAIIS